MCNPPSSIRTCDGGGYCVGNSSTLCIQKPFPNGYVCQSVLGADDECEKVCDGESFDCPASWPTLTTCQKTGRCALGQCFFGCTLPTVDTCCLVGGCHYCSVLPLGGCGGSTCFLVSDQCPTRKRQANVFTCVYSATVNVVSGSTLTVTNLDTTSFVQVSNSTLLIISTDPNVPAITTSTAQLGGTLVLDVSSLDIYDGMTIALVSGNITSQWNSVQLQATTSECVAYSGKPNSRLCFSH
jgi:hypothetical protein